MLANAGVQVLRDGLFNDFNTLEGLKSAWKRQKAQVQSLIGIQNAKGLSLSPFLYYLGNEPRLFCRYRKAGNGQNTQDVAINPAVVSYPRAWLEADLGPLDSFVIIESHGVEFGPDGEVWIAGSRPSSQTAPSDAPEPPAATPPAPAITPSNIAPDASRPSSEPAAAPAKRPIKTSKRDAPLNPPERPKPGVNPIIDEMEAIREESRKANPPQRRPRRVRTSKPRSPRGGQSNGDLDG
jgi:hypothetical protein